MIKYLIKTSFETKKWSHSLVVHPDVEVSLLYQRRLLKAPQPSLYWPTLDFSKDRGTEQRGRPDSSEAECTGTYARNGDVAGSEAASVEAELAENEDMLDREAASNKAEVAEAGSSNKIRGLRANSPNIDGTRRQ